MQEHCQRSVNVILNLVMAIRFKQAPSARFKTTGWAMPCKLHQASTLRFLCTRHRTARLKGMAEMSLSGMPTYAICCFCAQTVSSSQDRVSNKGYLVRHPTSSSHLSLNTLKKKKYRRYLDAASWRWSQALHVLSCCCLLGSLAAWV